MNITINGKAFELPQGSTLEDALTAAAIGKQGIATALNNTVVPAAMRPRTQLADGDSITVITAFYGG